MYIQYLQKQVNDTVYQVTVTKERVSHCNWPQRFVENKESNIMVCQYDQVQGVFGSIVCHTNGVGYGGQLRLT